MITTDKTTPTCYGRHAADDSDDKQDVVGRHGGGTAAAAVWPHTLPCSRRTAASLSRPRVRAPGRANGRLGTANPPVRSRPGSFLLPSSSGYDLGASASPAVVVGDMEIKRCTRYQSRTHIVNNGRADECGRSGVVHIHIQSALYVGVNSALKLRYIPHGSIVF